MKGRKGKRQVKERNLRYKFNKTVKGEKDEIKYKQGMEKTEKGSRNKRRLKFGSNK